MKKHWYIYLFLIVLSSFLLTGCTKKETEEVEEQSNVVEETEEEQEENIVEESTQEGGYIEGFGKTKQVLGETSDFEYTIEDITLSEKEEYQEFLFEMSSSQEGVSMPLFTVEPILTNGVIRVSLTNIFDDNTTITHSKSVKVDKGAITSLSRIVTDSNTTRAYDIGVLGSNMFKLEVEEPKAGRWIFSVKVSYDTKYTQPTIDFGSTEFSSETQEIEGVTAIEGAKIMDYSFLYSSGIVKFSLEVASGASNPIPSVSAYYDGAGILVVTFPSLEQDKVSSWGSTINLPGGIVVTVAREGVQSVYSFSGISNKKPFKMSASQSPNLVIIEIDI